MSTLVSRRVAARSVRLVALAALSVGLVGQADAALITLTASNGAGTTSFASSLSWSNGAAPSAGNDYLVASARTLRNVANSTGTQVFAGDRLLLGDGTTAGIMIFKNSGTGAIVSANWVLDNGELQAGGDASGAAHTTTVEGTIAINGAGGRLNPGAAGRVMILNPNLTGSAPLSTTNQAGTITLNGNNSGFSGNVTLSGNQAQLVRLGHANALGTGTIAISNGDNLSIDNTSGAAMTLGGNNNITLNNNLVFVGSNDLNLGTGTVSMVATRTITANGAGKILTIGGNISGGANTLNVLGTGTLSLTGTNTLGAVNIGPNGGSTALRINNGGAAGSGPIFVAGNGGSNRLELDGSAGGFTLANAINQNGKANATDQAPSIVNLAGNNTLSGTVTVQTGGSFSAIRSDAGTLTLGNATAALTTNATGVRTVTLRGAGDIYVSGPITNGTGTVAIEKKDAGTLTYAAANTYTGSTLIAGGTLALAASDRIDSASAIILAGGKLATAGYSDIVGVLGLTANSTIDLGNGASVLSFADSAAQTWTGTLTIDNWSGSLSGGGTDRIFVGSGTGSLTSAQLSQINFTGYTPGARQLTTGELLPIPEPMSLSMLGLSAMLLGRRRKA